MFSKLSLFKQAFVLTIFATLMMSCSSLLAPFLKDPTVAIQSFTLKKITLESLDFDLELKVDNPNPIPLTISQVAYSLQFSGEKVSDGIIDQGIDVPANGSNLAIVPFHFKYNSLGNLFTQIMNKSLNKEYELSGSAQVGIFNLPFFKKGELKLK